MLYFIRHGQTDANVQRLYAGSEWDVPLNDTGRAQARKFALANRDLLRQIDKFYVSPMIRTRETATIIAETAMLDVPFEMAEHLREWDVGEWSRKPYDEVGKILETLATPPGGESFAVFSARALGALRHAATQENERALVVAHGGIWRCYAHYANHSLHDIDNCAHMELCRVTLQNS